MWLCVAQRPANLPPWPPCVGDACGCDAFGVTIPPSKFGLSCGICVAGRFSANVLSCERCQVGEFCPAGSAVGIPCPLGSTTEDRGAESSDECGCPAGTYATPATQDEINCEPCKADDMLCPRTGLTLATVPLRPSRWRLSVMSAFRTWGPAESSKVGEGLIPSQPHQS